MLMEMTNFLMDAPSHQAAPLSLLAANTAKEGSNLLPILGVLASDIYTVSMTGQGRSIHRREVTFSPRKCLFA